MSISRGKREPRVWLKFAVLFAAWLAAAQAAAQQEASAQDGEVFVQTYCAACHSLALVYSQSGDKLFWRNTIDLMRAKHNLGVIPAEREVAIIDYLVTRAVSQPVLRRPPLAPAFLPKPGGG